MQNMNTEKTTEFANKLLALISEFNQEPSSCPHQIIQAVGSAFWTYILMASRPETIQENAQNALEFMKSGAEETMARAEDVYWQHYANTNGVGNA
jgi:hypothetical protein